MHATCVAIDGKGVLLTGKPGSGKSDLALRLIDSGAQLVADDFVDITVSDATLFASAPEALRGKLEVRGLGIVTLPFAGHVPLALAVALVERGAVERLPEPEFFHCLGVRLRLHSLCAFDVSACAKIRMFLQAS